MINEETKMQISIMEKINPKKSFISKYYNIDHKCCPNGGNTSYTSTLCAPHIALTNSINYKDENSCFCTCGFIHTIDNRISKEDFKRRFCNEKLK